MANHRITIFPVMQKCKLDEELFPESADAFLKNDLLSFSAYIL